MEEIIDKTKGFPPIVQMIIYDRLGYKRFPGQYSYNNKEIDWFISFYMKKDAHFYYRLVQRAAELLLCDDIDPEVIEELERDTEDLTPKDFNR